VTSFSFGTEKVTVKLALPLATFSATVTLPMVMLVLSLSLMVPAPWPSTITGPPVGLERFTKKPSLSSSRVSPTTGTASVRVLTPVVKVRVPEAVV
jgi:hypothetical protein